MRALICPQCGKRYQAKDDVSAKQAKCPACGVVLRISASVHAGPRGGEASDLAITPAPASEHARSPSDGATVTMQAKEPTAEVTAVFAAPSESDVTSFLAPAQKADEIGRLGPYRVLSILGRGGMGAIFKAEDPALRRLVALKVMLPNQAVNAAAKHRFLREARSAAAIKHDHIITIHQVGEDRDIPYLAMEFLEGEPLNARLQRQPPLSLDEIVRIGREVAEGLAAAHESGLVHRDIKPGNLWLEARRGRTSGDPSISGELSRSQPRDDRAGSGFRVKILDFGLARGVAEHTRLTGMGDIVGTPAYMAPEQAAGVPVDFRCDLFSLGCVLYRMVTGELPFKGADTPTTLTALTKETPVAPAVLNPKIPAALSTLIMRLLAKDRRQRPESAAAVAEVLANLSSTKTQPAATATLPVPARWALGGVLGMTVLFLVLWLAGVFGGRDPNDFGWVRPTDSLSPTPGSKNGGVDPLPTGKGYLIIDTDEPDLQVAVQHDNKTLIQKTDQRKIELAPGEYAVEIVAGPAKMRLIPERVSIRANGETSVRVLHADVVESAKDFRIGDPIHSQALVARPAPIPGVRTWTLETRGHRGMVHAIAYSPTVRKVASAGQDGAIRIWDPAAGGKLLSLLPAHSQPASSGNSTSGVIFLAWNDDGKTLASVGQDRQMRLWNMEANQLLRWWTAPVGSIGSIASQRLAFAPDGKILACGLTKGRVGLWRTSSGLPLEDCRGHADSQVMAVAWAPDGARLASAADDGTVCLWEYPSRRLLATLNTKPAGVSLRAVAFAPDGLALAAVDTQANVTVWDTTTHKEIRSWKSRDKGTAHSLAWAREGADVVLGVTGSNGMSVWQVNSDKPLRSFTLKQWMSCWLPDLNMQASSSVADGTVRFSGLDSGKLAYKSVTGYRSEYVSRFFWSGDSKSLASAGPSSACFQWDLDKLQFKGTWPASSTAALSFCLDRGGEVLAVSGGYPIDLWKVPSNKGMTALTDSKGKSSRVLFSPDGQKLASQHTDKVVRVWEVASAKRLLELPAQTAVLGWSPNGDLLACQDDKDKLRLWDMRSGTVLDAQLSHKGEIAWSPTGRFILCGTRVWDWQSDKVQSLDSVKGMGAWLPDEKTLVFYESASGTLHHFDPTTGKLQRSLERATAGSAGVFSPDGKLLAVPLGMSSLRLVHTDSGKAYGTIMFVHDVASKKGKEVDPQYLFISPEGDFRTSSARIAPELVYVAQTDQGIVVLSPSEFTTRFGWTNKADIGWGSP